MVPSVGKRAARALAGNHLFTATTNLVEFLQPQYGQGDVACNCDIEAELGGLGLIATRALKEGEEALQVPQELWRPFSTRYVATKARMDAPDFVDHLTRAENALFSGVFWLRNTNTALQKMPFYKSNPCFCRNDRIRHGRSSRHSWRP